MREFFKRLLSSDGSVSSKRLMALLGTIAGLVMIIHGSYAGLMMVIESGKYLFGFAMGFGVGGSVAEKAAEILKPKR